MRSTHPRKRQRLVVMHGTTATIRPCLAKLCSDHEIFNTKIKNFANFECFTKFLCLENLELYGMLHTIWSCHGSTDHHYFTVKYCTRNTHVHLCLALVPRLCARIYVGAGEARMARVTFAVG